MTAAAAVRKPSPVTLTAFFSGKKAVWLPLYQRLLARSRDLNGIPVRITRVGIRLGDIGTIRVTARGLEILLRIKTSPRSDKSITKKVVLSDSHQIDEDLLTWIRTAKLLAASKLATRKSTRKQAA